MVISPARALFELLKLPKNIGRLLKAAIPSSSYHPIPGWVLAGVMPTIPLSRSGLILKKSIESIAGTATEINPIVRLITVRHSTLKKC